MKKEYVAVDKEELDNALIKILEYATGRNKKLKLSQKEARIISVAVIYSIKKCEQDVTDEDAVILGVVE